MMKTTLSTLLLSASIAYCSEEPQHSNFPQCETDTVGGESEVEKALSGVIMPQYLVAEVVFPDAKEFKAFFTHLTEGLTIQLNSTSDLYQNYLFVNPDLYEETLKRIDELKALIHPQYYKNLLVTMWHESFYKWPEDVFAGFLESAKILLIQNNDCVPVLRGISLFANNDNFEEKKIKMAYEICAGRTDPMDVFTILCAVKKAVLLPDITPALMAEYKEKPAQCFADFLSRSKIN